jgi:hypothetical protein
MRKFIKRTLLVLIGLFIVSYAIWPHWPWRLTSRPLFYHWVGASSLAWGVNQPVNDRHGAWLFFDYELNILVLFLPNDSKLAPYPPHPSSTQGIFPTNPPTVINPQPNTLFIVFDEGKIEMIKLTPGIFQEIHDLIGHSTEPPDVVATVLKLYEGPEAGRLSSLIGGETNMGKK